MKQICANCIYYQGNRGFCSIAQSRVLGFQTCEHWDGYSTRTIYVRRDND